MVEQKDYPDWTGLAQLIGTNIMLAVDVQGGYIMLPVDWQSQFVGVYLQPEWSAFKAIDKEFYKTGDTAGWNTYITLSYTPTAPRTLYICGFSYGAYVQAAADYDHFIYNSGSLSVDDAIVFKGVALGGDSVIFPKPIVIGPGNEMELFSYNWTNLALTNMLSAFGYEI